MAPAERSLSEHQAVVFSVTDRVVMIKRASEIAFGVSGLLMIAVFYPWNGPPPPDSIAHIVWPLLAVGVAAPMAFVWFRWKRVPAGATGGTLRVSSEGIDYRIGPDHVQLLWSQITAVYPIKRPPDTRVRAVWLPANDPAPPNSSRMTLLEIAHLQNPYRPVERPDGILLPLTLFGLGKDKAEEIMSNLRQFHAAACAMHQSP